LVIVGAGSRTVASTMEVATFYSLYHPEIGRRLQTELRSAYPETTELLSHRELEKLPYLVSSD
jgi:Cytochrome P450